MNTKWISAKKPCGLPSPSRNFTVFSGECSFYGSLMIKSGSTVNNLPWFSPNQQTETTVPGTAQRNGNTFYQWQDTPSPRPAPPTFFHWCVTWFPLDDTAVNDLTEQVLLPVLRKELKTGVEQAFTTVFLFFNHCGVWHHTITSLEPPCLLSLPLSSTEALFTKATFI